MKCYTIITGKGRGQKKTHSQNESCESTKKFIKEVFYYENYKERFYPY